MAQQGQDAFVMDCIVVGGVAGGTLLRNIRQDAQHIQLARPDYVKPLASSRQENPEVVKEKDVYEVHPIQLVNSVAHQPSIFGIAVVEGETLTWAFSQLVIGYVENETNKLVAEGLIEKH